MKTCHSFDKYVAVKFVIMCVLDVALIPPLIIFTLDEKSVKKKSRNPSMNQRKLRNRYLYSHDSSWPKALKFWYRCMNVVIPNFQTYLRKTLKQRDFGVLATKNYAHNFSEFNFSLNLKFLVNIFLNFALEHKCALWCARSKFPSHGRSSWR